MSLRYNAHQATGTLDALTVGLFASGSSLFMGGHYAKVADLSAVVVLDAETNTLTVAAQWQGSNDASTWVNLAHATQNPAAVVLATGTAGADAAVTVAVPAPVSAYSFKFCRVNLVVGGTTGTTNDTFTIGYSYRQLTGAESAR